MVVYLGEVGLKFWEVGGDGKALKGRPFDVTTCRFFCIICVDGGISKDTTSKSDGWSFRGHSCMVVYLGEVGLKFWEVGGDGKAFRMSYFDVMMCRFCCYYLRRWWEITGYG
mmetsp:Transcript_3777/g.6835  ORF Transcript_3777/g.6835 Transcript_3777/m.6835 type:complete len:112 (+) Transcript_3777:1056-1391(+)